MAFRWFQGGAIHHDKGATDMKLMDKISKSYDCLNAFTASNNEVMKQFVDIFSPMLFNENEGRMEIGVGHKESESKFSFWLKTTVHKFNVVLSCCNEEPQFIIKDMVNRATDTITAINLALMRNLVIKAVETEDGNSYKIDFNYNNQIDYIIRLVVHKQ